MRVNVIIFGQLTDIAGRTLSLNDVSDTDDLINRLNKLYPSLAERKYVVAVDKQVVTANTPLNNNNTVALMPPFSGG